MPVNVSDVIERPNRRPIRVKGWGERVFSAILGYDGEPVTLVIYRPGFTVRGVLEQVDDPITTMGVRGSPTTYAMLVVRGRVSQGVTTQSGTGTLGVNELGVALLGVDT